MEDLITALIVDAFTALGDARTSGRSRQQPAKDAGDDHDLSTMGGGTPGRFSAIFGNPIPGHVASAEVTVPLVRRLPTLYIRFAEAQRQQRFAARLLSTGAR